MSITAHIFGVSSKSPRSGGFWRLWQQLAIATNWPVLVSVVVLCGLGLCSIWAHSITLRPGDPGRAEWQKQLAFIGIGAGCMFLFQAVNYLRLGRFAWGFYIASMLLIIYTITPGVPRHGFASVPVINGAHPWIKFGSFSLEPAELMKVAFIMVLARYLRFRSNYRRFKGLLAPFALALVPLVLIMMQPDLGTALIFIPALFAMLFVAGAKGRHLMAIVGLGIAVAPIMWLSGSGDGAPNLPMLRHLPVMIKKYQRERVQAMFQDEAKTQRDKGYQQKLAITAFGSGGITGKGIGQIPVGQHVPECYDDMVFALIGEQFGLFGSAVVLGAYAILFAAGIEIASNTREPFGRLVAMGVVAMLAGQTFLNLTVCLKLMPVTGVTLPFVSYGGSSLVASFMAAGLLLNIGQNRPFVMARDAFEYNS